MRNRLDRFQGGGARAGLAALAAAMLLPAMAVGAETGAPPEKPGTRGVEPGTPVQRMEPEAWRRGSAEAAGRRTDAVARAVERLRREGGPPDEVYALVMITDRRTGYREMFSRGVPDPRIPAYLEDMRNAPAGQAYFESEKASADAEVETVVRSVHVRPRVEDPDALSPEEEDEIDLRERNAGGGLSHRIDGGLRERILSGAIDLAGAARIPIAIELRGVPRLRLPKPHDPATGGLLWAGLEAAAARERAIIARKRDMAARQAPIAEAVKAAGGSLHYASWTSGAVEADVPARAIPALAARPEVFRLDYREPQRELTHFHGGDYRPAMDADDYNPYHDGDSGGISSKHSYSSRIVMALGEKCIDEVNPAYLTAGGSWDRAWYYDCDPIFSPCSQGNVENCENTSSHGTKVAGLMAGDFLDGQDPLVANPERYTGTCEECRFFFLQDEGLNQRTKVLDAVCDLGVDIFESSIGSTSISCNGSGSYDGTLQDMVNCDVIYVQAAGNEGSTGSSCTTVYPADHPWTFTVGGMYTRDDCTTAGDYYTADCQYDDDASRGGRNYDGGKGTATLIDIAAPYRLGNLIVPNTRNPVQFTTGTGTSYATPLVAGLMGRFLDWWATHVSNSLFYDNRMRNYFLLFGDRSQNHDGISRTSNSHSSFWGSGRVGLVPFDDLATWDIRRTSCSLDANDSCSFTDTISSNATFYKAVVWHDGKDYSNEPAIGLTLNPSGCGTVTRSVTRYDSKAMLVYSADVAAGELNGCTSVSITIENVKSGTSGNRRFHYGAYATTQSERNY